MSFSIFLTVILIWTGCEKPTSSLTIPFQTGIDPTNAYSLFAGITAPAPVPSDVRNLQAGGAVWMDMQVLCRFQASSNVIASMLAHGYQQTNWDGVAIAMHSNSYTNVFSPSWNPDGIRDKTCYVKRVIRKPGEDILYLVVDCRDGIVYAVGEGAVNE